MCICSSLGNAKPRENDDKRDFLADAMREMESGGKSSNFASTVRRVPNVIRVVMRPEVPPTRRHHRGHRHRHLGGLASVLKLAEGFNKLRNGSRRNKTAQLFNTQNTLKETVQFLESVNSQLENMSKFHGKSNKQKLTKPVKPANISLNGDDDVMVTDSFPLIPELRSIVEHGKPFNPDVTRAAFARAKQIVWDSVGQDSTTTGDVGHLNNTRLTNAVALLEMAVREAEKMERNDTKVDQDQKINAVKMIPKSSETSIKPNQSKYDAVQLNVLKQLLLEEIKQANYTKDKAGILISDIPFQKLRNKEQNSLMQVIPSASNSSVESKVNLGKSNAVGETQALLENYTSFITNILKAAHLSVLKNFTEDSTSLQKSNTTNVNPNSQSQAQQPNNQEQSAQHISFEQLNEAQHPNPSKEQEKEKHLSFANVAQEQQQQQQHKQHLQPIILSKERLAARKAFGTAQKLVKAFLARQELYKAEREFFNKIHEMLNKTTSKNSLTAGQASDAKESKITSQPTVASPIQSPLSQSPINTASSSSIGGEDNKKETSDAQKKFEEAAHLEEKVAAQQDDMYDALMGHTIGTVKGGGDGAFDEEGAIHESPEQDGADDSYNTEDYGDYKDSDEEAEKKFYHEQSQGDFESKGMGDSSISLRSKISSIKAEQSGSTESSNIGKMTPQGDQRFNKKNFYPTAETSGDSSGDD